VQHNVLVTGGAGFIGSNYVRRALATTDVRIVVFDKLTYAGHLATLDDVRSHPRFEFVQGDIADRTAVSAVLRDKGITRIVNFAAETHVDRSIDGPSAFVQTNIVGTFELLEAARALLQSDPSARETFRFLHVSTDEVYGTLGPTGAFTEQTPYAPSSPYSASKASADHLVHAYVHTFNVPALITNCSNNYGPFQFPEKLIPVMVLNALHAQRLPIYGDGGNVRDWLYVDDHCDGIALALEHGRVGEKYNIGGHGERNNLQVVDAICASLEKLVPARENAAMQRAGFGSYVELKHFVADRPGHDRRYAIDASKIRDELRWTAKHHFEEGIERTVRWYVENRAWCDTVARDQSFRKRIGLGERTEQSA
jgi:dTDP-glucose 4,6-dehydratase